MKTISQTLEMSGPRNQVWRPALADIYQKARTLVKASRTYEALLTAQDAHVAHFGDMHDVDFRVVTKEVTVTFMGAFDINKWEAQDKSGANPNT